MPVLFVLLALAAPKPVTLARAGAGKWTLGPRAYDPAAAQRACKDVQGKTIALQANGADWGELRAALLPLVPCQPSNLQVGSISLTLPTTTPRPVVILQGETTYVWHEGSRTKLAVADLDGLKALGPLSLYMAPTTMLNAQTTDRLARLGPLELAVTVPAGVRVTAGEATGKENVDKASGLLARTFGAAEMPTPGEAPPPTWINATAKRCLSKSGAAVVWAVGVVDGIFNAALAKSTADNRARAEITKFLESIVETSKGKTKTIAIGTVEQAQIVDRYSDDARKIVYSLAELPITKAKTEELDTCADPDPGVTWTWQPVDVDGGPKRTPPDWTRSLPDGLAGAAPGVHFRYASAAKSPYATERAAAEAAFLAAVKQSLAKACPAAAPTKEMLQDAEWFADNPKGTWILRAVLRWSTLPDAMFAGCARRDAEIALGRPPPMQNAPAWVTRGTSETFDALFVAAATRDAAALWTAVQGKISTVVPSGWPGAPGAEFLAAALAKDAKATQTWRDLAYEEDYALNRVEKLQIARRLRECQALLACPALTADQEKQVIEQLQKGLFTTFDGKTPPRWTSDGSGIREGRLDGVGLGAVKPWAEWLARSEAQKMLETIAQELLAALNKPPRSLDATLTTLSSAIKVTDTFTSEAGVYCRATLALDLVRDAVRKDLGDDAAKRIDAVLAALQ